MEHFSDVEAIAKLFTLTDEIDFETFRAKPFPLKFNVR